MLKKPGARFSTRAHQRPLECVLTPGADGLELELHHDVFVAFGTGDLDAQADRLAPPSHGHAAVTLGVVVGPGGGPPDGWCLDDGG